jgi:hypothetical protein
MGLQAAGRIVVQARGMINDLWQSNTAARFWCCQPDVPQSYWQIAMEQALPVLELDNLPDDLEALPAHIIGEGQFGPAHWQLSGPRRLYYRLKPLLPRPLVYLMRRLHRSSAWATFVLRWPIEDRYVRFLWETMRQLLLLLGCESMFFRPFWPEARRFAFVITHDIETAGGQAFAMTVADLDEMYGFRSAFNFVPERYPLDHALIAELRQRGFEIGVHGLRHDGRLFSSHAEFARRAQKINDYLRTLQAAGFRSPLTHRQPEWMQALKIEYDLSFFDSDPYEPIPGGTMSIWPYQLGHFMELPYTLVQDCTLANVLCETTPRLWLEKVDFIEQYCGMALVNTHPDYLRDEHIRRIYADFLSGMQERDAWAALPRDVALWWRSRREARMAGSTQFSTAFLADGQLTIRV